MGSMYRGIILQSCASRVASGRRRHNFKGYLLKRFVVLYHDSTSVRIGQVVVILVW
jgi:hypothetical protein